jgi:anthranilate synthase component 1
MYHDFNMAAPQPSQPPGLPVRKDFERLAAAHTLVPVYRSLTADLETPVSAFLRLAAGEPECFMLESVEGGERVGRYTFIGVRPTRRIVAWGKSIEVTETGQSLKPRSSKATSSPCSRTRSTASNQRAFPDCLHSPPEPSASSPTMSSARSNACPRSAKDDLGMPDACLMFFDEVLAFDHVKKAILLIVTADLSRHEAQGRLYRRHRAPRPPREETRQTAAHNRKRPKPHGKLSRQGQQQEASTFLNAITASKEYIAAGDIFQVVVSQRFEVEPGVDPFLHLPLAAHRQSVAVHVLPPLRIEEARLGKAKPEAKPEVTSSVLRPSY